MSYDNLKKRNIELSNLSKAAALLQWDRETIMPPGAAAERAQILAQLSVEIHRKATDTERGQWLEAAAKENLKDEWDKRNLSLMQESYALSKALPEKLVSDLTKTSSASMSVYDKAKASSDWNAVETPLTDLVALVKEKAKIYGDVLGMMPYDALLSRSARGNKTSLIDLLFADLKKELIPLVIQIREKQKNRKADFDFTIDAPEQQKQAFIRAMAEQTGFSFDKGRLDPTVHPFSGGTRHDKRITYGRTETIAKTMHSTLHECGHARYTQNLPEEWEGQPVGGDSDLALHESQSLAVEKQMAYSPEFLKFAYDALVAAAPEMKRAGDAESFKNAFHKVEPSFIRFEADEATYPLHVMHRYDMEKMLFADEIAVRDIPAVWNEKFEKDFGIKVREHKKGCMQDIHWFIGLFGYFPTYTQGALYAAQLFAAAKRDIPNVSVLLAAGNMGPVIGWMTEHIHQYGQFYDGPDLIERATGEKPTARYFLDHLKARYLA